jgi:hypothetical protein
MLALKIIFGIIGFIIALLVIIPIYILSSLWEMEVLKTCNYDKPWMAWIPFANIWALADVAFRGNQKAPLYMLNVQLPVIAYKIYPIVCVPVFMLLGWLLNKLHIGFLSTALEMAIMAIFFASIMQPFAYCKQTQFTQTQSIIGGLISIYGLYLIKKVLGCPNTLQSNFGTGQNQNPQYYNQQNTGYNQQNTGYNQQNMNLGGNQQGGGLDGLGQVDLNKNNQ